MELDERVYEEGKQPVVAAEDEETGDVEEGEAAAYEEGKGIVEEKGVEGKKEDLALMEETVAEDEIHTAAVAYLVLVFAAGHNPSLKQPRNHELAGP